MVIKYDNFVKDLNKVKAFLEIDEVHASKEVVKQILEQMIDTAIHSS